VKLHKEKSPPQANFKCKVVEKNGDILTSPELFKAIPIAADFDPYVGLARQVIDVYGKPADADQARTGQVLRHKFNEQLSWLFLITAIRSFHKANENLNGYLRNVEMALDNLVGFIKAKNVQEIAILYLCSGRGRLNWLFLKDCIMTKLQDVEVTVAVYHLSRAALGEAAAEQPNPPRSAPDVVENILTGIENGEEETHTLNLVHTTQNTQPECAPTIAATPQTDSEAPTRPAGDSDETTDADGGPDD
jgi:hypothetical protein